jgi:DNA-binding response OmpR family regulator
MSERRKRVLAVDDDEDIRAVLLGVLQRADFEVITASTGTAALQAVFDHRPDAMVLDIGLPDLHGFEVVRRVRELTDLPLLLLTARTMEQDKVRGLGLGADDYVTKPFSNAELVARLHALLRRAPAGPDAPQVMVDGPLQLDLRSRVATLAGSPVELTPTDWSLLVTFLSNRHIVLSTGQLLNLAWGDPAAIGPDRVKYAVLRLRRRLGWNDPASSPIEAVRGFGYRYNGLDASDPG